MTPPRILRLALDFAVTLALVAVAVLASKPLAYWLLRACEFFACSLVAFIPFYCIVEIGR